MNSSDIVMYFHCGKCVKELPDGVSPADYKQLSVGATSIGRLQVWCDRHDTAVATLELARPMIPGHGDCECEECKKRARN
jgi:hypothetical protein